MVCLLLWGARSGDAFVAERRDVVAVDLLGTGFGRAETPQFVKPRITPPLERMILPAVRAMLLCG
jgi:hypothetical protein